MDHNYFKKSNLQCCKFITNREMKDMIYFLIYITTFNDWSNCELTVQARLSVIGTLEIYCSQKYNLNKNILKSKICGYEWIYVPHMSSALCIWINTWGSSLYTWLDLYRSTSPAQEIETKKGKGWDIVRNLQMIGRSFQPPAIPQVTSQLHNGVTKHKVHHFSIFYYEINELTNIRRFKHYMNRFTVLILYKLVFSLTILKHYRFFVRMPKRFWLYKNLSAVRWNGLL